MEIKDLGQSEIEIIGEISADDFDSFRGAALERLTKRYQIEGFRPGHAPVQILEQKLGREKILTETAELCLSRHYPKILAEHKIDALGQPTIMLTKLAVGNPLGFRIKTAVFPQFALPDYRSLAAQIPAAEGDKRRIKLLEAVRASTKITLPPLLIHSERHKMLAEFKGEIKAMGLDYGEYLKRIGKTENELLESWKETAAKRVEINLLLDAIAKQEKISADPARMEEEMKRFAAAHPDAPADRLRAYLTDLLTNEAVINFLEQQSPAA